MSILKQTFNSLAFAQDAGSQWQSIMVDLWLKYLKVGVSHHESIPVFKHIVGLQDGLCKLVPVGSNFLGICLILFQGLCIQVTYEKK